MSEVVSSTIVSLHLETIVSLHLEFDGLQLQVEQIKLANSWANSKNQSMSGLISKLNDQRCMHRAPYSRFLSID
jgi:hypothetical protein